jgi:PEP-CTERM motif
MKMQITLLIIISIACSVLGAIPAAAGTLYSNGPFNGDIDAWTINEGFSVSDSFVVANNSSIQDLHFVYWVFPDGEELTTVDMQIGSSSFGGNPQTLTGVTNTYLGANSFGYSLYEADYTFSGIAWSGSGWVTLSNACSTSGCSTEPIYWDENDGPSLAYENEDGMIPSESFTLTGAGGGGTTPEPSSVLLLASGILGVAGVGRRRWL